VTAADPCPHCATIGGLAAATRDALDEIRALVAEFTAAPKPAARSKGARTHGGDQ
jgi:hypothetical protein